MQVGHFMLLWLVGVLFGAVGDVHVLGDSEVPFVCRDLGPTGRETEPDERTLATLTMTMCAARERMAALDHLENTDTSRLALDLAAAPTFAILDDIARSPSPAWRIVAHQLRGDLYVAMAVRLRNASGESNAQRSSRRVADWLERARRAYANVRTIAAARPDALANPLARNALIASAPLTFSP
jgi:hypothetical protein